jgi:hypothetical protein
MYKDAIYRAAREINFSVIINKKFLKTGFKNKSAPINETLSEIFNKNFAMWLI